MENKFYFPFLKVKIATPHVVAFRGVKWFVKHLSLDLGLKLHLLNLMTCIT